VIPPQTVVTLYIYRVGRSCPARNPFTARNSQGLLYSTRTRGPLIRPVWPLPDRLQDTPPVKPLRNTGLTDGVSLIGLVPNLGANIYPLFFSKACCLKNNPKVDVTLHRPFFGLRAIFALNRPYPIKHPARHLDEISSSEDHVWFEDRWMVAPLCDE
jgi:hypothetical protein